MEELYKGKNLILIFRELKIVLVIVEVYIFDCFVGNVLLEGMMFVRYMIVNSDFLF